MVDITKLAETDKTNKHGKVSTAIAKKIDKALNDQITGDNTDTDTIKKLIYELIEAYKADKNAMAILEYLYMRLNDLVEFIAADLSKNIYTITEDYKLIVDTVKDIKEALGHQNLVIPASNRASIIQSHNIVASWLKIIGDEKAKRSKETKGDKYSINVSVDDFKQIQQLIFLNYPGGLNTAFCVQRFNNLILSVAFEIQNDAKLIQLFELVTNDVDKAMQELVGSTDAPSEAQMEVVEAEK